LISTGHYKPVRFYDTDPAIGGIFCFSLAGFMPLFFKMRNMKKENQEEPKPDLRHDTMEFSAASDGDDKLDIDDERYEEEEISAEELEILEDEDPDTQEAALNSVETDSEADDDLIFEETGEQEDEWPDQPDKSNDAEE